VPAGTPSVAVERGPSCSPQIWALASPPPASERSVRIVSVPTFGTSTVPEAGIEASSTPAMCVTVTALSPVVI
jgi:hypothetical protein